MRARRERRDDCCEVFGRIVRKHRTKKRMTMLQLASRIRQRARTDARWLGPRARGATTQLLSFIGRVERRMNKRVYPESVAMIAVGLDEDPVEFFRKLMKGVKARRRLRALRRQMRRPAGSGIR